jgi:hypothetical protein
VTGWMAAWLAVGASIAAWRWHVENEEARWAGVADELRLLLEVHRPAALGLGMLSAVILLMSFVADVLGWPGTLVRVWVARRRGRRR